MSRANTDALENSLTPLDESQNPSFIQQELERLIVAGFECINARDFGQSTPAGQELISRTARSFRVVFSASPKAVTKERANVIVKTHFTENPNDRYHIQNVSSSVDLKNKTAVVFLDIILEGGSTGASVNILTECRWAKNGKGRWVRLGYRSVRNMAW